MRIDFARTAGSSHPRPIVEIGFAEALDVRFPALVDSGAFSNRFNVEIASAVGIDASVGAVERVAMGGKEYSGNTVDVQLRLATWTWTAPVTFLQGWDHPYGIVGLRGFFDKFSVRFEGVDQYFALTRRPRHG